MRQLIQTNDVVLLSYIGALLTEARIEHVVFDVHMSVMEGSLGVLPRRVLVEEGDWLAAVDLLRKAGIDVPDDRND